MFGGTGRTSGAIAALVAALVLAGCGSGDSTAGSTTSRPAPDPSPAEPADSPQVSPPRGPPATNLPPSMRRSTSTTTTTAPATTTSPPPTAPPATTAPPGPSASCDTYRETKYIPANSSVVFERDGVEVDIRRIYYKALTLQVSSSDGTYREAALDPDTTLFEGLEIGTSQLGFDWVWDYFQEQLVQQPGQVKTIVRVYDCWDYVRGPDDVF